MSKMNLKIAVFFAALVLAGCAQKTIDSPSSSSPATPSGADVSVLMTEGELLLQSGSSWRAIDADAELKAGDVIRTGKGARTLISLSKLGQVYLSEDTELGITDLNRFDQHFGKAVYMLLSDTSEQFSTEALGHYFETKGAMEVSVNVAASRVNAKALKSSMDTVARFPEVNDLPQKLNEGEEITLDPASESLVSRAAIPAEYYSGDWFSKLTASNPDYFTAPEADDQPVSENSSGTSATPKASSAPSSAPAKAVSTGGLCKPYLTAKKDSTYKGNLLYWNRCNSDEFQFYKVVKSSKNSNPVYPGDSVVASSSNQSLTNTIDKEVAPNRTYYYRVCVVHRLAKVTCGNVASVAY